MISRVSLLRLQHARNILTTTASTSTKPSTLTIGAVSVQLHDAKNPDFVPAYYGLKSQPPQDLLPHLRWLIQKDKLKQDVFLLGVPGKIRLELVLRYLEATNREFEYLPITRDTTEADIKQRREIRDGTAYYTDLCAVRAALNGRVLVIDGVERAERNVLPILNNLLENREMQLDDGRFLMKHDKYDELKEKYDEATLKKMGMERVSENFHVIALGIPVPRFPGNSLDPPFRSRFQCRNIEELSFNSFLAQAKRLAPKVKESELNDLISVVYAYNSEASSTRPRIATSVVERTLQIWNENKNYSASEILNFTYPAKEVLSEGERELIDTFKNKFDLTNHEHNRRLQSNDGKLSVSVELDKKQSKSVPLKLPTPSHPTTFASKWVPTRAQESLLADLAIAFSKGDFVLIGPKGSGKSRILGQLSRRLNFNYTTMVLHQDMNTRELIQRRHMKENGDTVWEDSILVSAARNGEVCVLDGVEMVHPSVLMSLAQLIYHRRFDLPNGNRLIGDKEFSKIMKRDGIDEAAMNERGVFRIPDSFRVLFVGESQSKEHKWINENVLSMLPFYTVPDLSLPYQAKIISQITNGSNKDSVNKLITFVEKIKASHDTGLKNTAPSLSLRRLIHIAKRDIMQPGHLKELVEKAALSKFLPVITKETFEHELKAAGITDDLSIRTREDQKYLEMIRAATERAEDEALIPNVLFHHNEQHNEVLEDMARDMKLGSHLLLIGNQGVGKNKLTDRFLHLINRPRQYMQLHRDTTVQTLTMQTVVENGIIRHEDSALVKAARSGQFLVIDEADKAPLHVIAILKSLLDTGNLVLGDGRSLRPAASFTEADKTNDRLVPIHPNFRIIMLANRPGFPFLGNNLFAVLGDLFAIHMIDHPGRDSELEMIQKYGPTVPKGTLNQLLNIFNELRDKTDQGLLQYPYSTRELVNIVRHCNEFPTDPLPEVCRNVFDFDSYSDDAISIIQEVFQKHGVPLGVTSSRDNVFLTERISLGEMKPIGKWSRHKISFPQTHGFKPAVPVEVEMPKRIGFSKQKVVKKGNRNQFFSEQHCVWQLPVNEAYIVCDGIRVNDDLLVASAVPKKLIHCKDFMNTDEAIELNINELASFNPIHKPRYRLAYLGGDNVLLHEEETNFTAIVSLPDQMGAVVKQETSITGTLGAMITGTNYPWSLSNQKSNHALLYQCGGHEMVVYTDEKDGVTVQKGSVPFNIKRIYAHAPQQWTIVSTDNENYLLKLENGHWSLEKVENNLDGGLDTVATKIGPNGVTMVADPFYYIEGDHSGTMSGVLRKKVENPVSSREHGFSEELCAKNDLAREVVFLGNTLVRAVPKFHTPKEYVDDKLKPYDHLGFLETIDMDAKKICYVPVPTDGTIAFFQNHIASLTKTAFHLVPWDDDKVLTIDVQGKVKSFELQMSSLGKSFNDWKRMTGGADDEKMRMEFDRSPDDVDFDKLDEPTLGKIDPNNAPHHGGNQWMGGTGGYNTAGLGGIGGPFRLDAGHDVHQMPDFAKEKVPEHILRKARAISKQEYAKKLREINMSEHDADAYSKAFEKVRMPSKKLASVIDQLEAKKKEREWTKHQTSGDLDDGKLIEGVTGEQNIYRRRVDKEPDPGAPQTKPKRLRLCLDVSGSMYRFNGFDHRLIKTIEATLMTMTALDGKTDKVKYDIIGHSGDSPCVSFVKADHYPKNDKERLDTLKKMIAHTQYCMSGDNTVESLRHAVNELAVKKDDFDETVVVLVSDANLKRYGIRPYKIKDAMLKEPSINTFVILIGNLGNEADQIQKELPAGKAFVLKDTSELPKIMETIFASTIAQ